MKKGVVVIGGVNMDIGGSPAEALVMRDSNPGSVTIRPGGVGRNIAHNLRLLGLEVSFITALGGDLYAASLRDNCGALGMDMSMSLSLPERRSSVYLYVNDEKGDMQLAISDMDIVSCITPEFLSRHIEKINEYEALVMDANIPFESIEYICNNCRIPIYADPVSTVKSRKLIPYLNKVFALKPNAIEAETMTGERDPKKAAQKLNEMGVKRAFVSVGSKGMIASENGNVIHVPPRAVEIVNTTGSGDASAAAMVWAGVMGLDLKKSAEAAVMAGAITARCVDANNPEINKICSSDFL